MPPFGHKNKVESEQVPPEAEQHAPPHMFGLHVVPIPRNALPELLQPDGLAMWHIGVLTDWQHAPTWSAHGSGIHTVPLPKYTPLQLIWNNRTQLAVGSVQQAPDWAKQGSGEQTVRRPWNTPDAAHCTLEAMLQARVKLLQHAPTHGLGVQLEPVPSKNIFVPVQEPCGVRVHTPLLRLQQAPHVLGEHDAACVHPPEHAPTVVMVQLLGVQQAPTQGFGEHDPLNQDPTQSNSRVIEHVPPVQQRPLEHSVCVQAVAMKD